MTPKWFAWLEWLERRDGTLAKLGLFAVGLVIAWELLRFLPPMLAARLRSLYMVGALLFFVGTAIGLYLNLGGQR